MQYKIEVVDKPGIFDAVGQGVKKDILDLGIGGRLWNDADGDRVRDPGETGLVGWTVTIAGVAVPAGYPTSQPSVANGAYLFGNLPAGNYKVCVTRMAGFTETYDLDGTNTPDCASLTLPSGQNRSDVDFGYR